MTDIGRKLIRYFQGPVLRIADEIDLNKLCRVQDNKCVLREDGCFRLMAGQKPVKFIKK